MSKKNRKSALVAVLDWGLGHATRCVPVIRELQKQNVRVVIGGGGASLQFLKEEFPDMDFYELPAYGITYPENGSMMVSMLFQFPRISRAIGQEKRMIDEIIKKEEIDFILSDNRYGCFSNKIKSVFISHQLNLQIPSGLSVFSWLVNRIHLNRIKKFDEIWIPDQENGFYFSGVLSQNKFSNTKRIGILSRFSGISIPVREIYDIVALISGPEPQRTIFENILRKQLSENGRKSLMVKGKPGLTEKVKNGTLTEFNHLNSVELEPLLSAANVIIARPGYSTIMDLATLGKGAIFVPTPGQTEQEYLAQYLISYKMAYTQIQKKFNIETAMTQLTTLGTLPKPQPNSLLANAIQGLICD